jgi:hypothetical protein
LHLSTLNHRAIITQIKDRGNLVFNHFIPSLEKGGDGSERAEEPDAIG